MVKPAKESPTCDHRPLVLGLQDIVAGKRRFHFESFWPCQDGFQETVQAASQSVQHGPCPFVSSANINFVLPVEACSGAKKIVGHINSQLALAREVLHQLEIAQDSRVLLAPEVWLRNKLNKHTTELFHIHARHRMIGSPKKKRKSGCG